MSPLLQKTYSIVIIIFLVTLTFVTIKSSKKNSNNIINQSTNTTPTSVEVKIIDWTTVTQLIADCKVKSIYQNHQLKVTLRTYDNQIFQTTENKIDDIFKLAKKYQGPCDIIQMISE
jgi:hypothetical protein